MRRLFVYVKLLILFAVLAQRAYAQDTLPEKEYIYNEKEKRWYEPFIIPAGLIGIGSFVSVNDNIISKYEVRDLRNKHFGNFHTEADDFLQFIPFAIAGIIELTENNKYKVIENRVINLVKTEAIMGFFTYSLKQLTAVKRPDSGAQNSFPSGHTAQAFAAAGFLYRTYCNDHSKWIGAGGFAIATSVGVLRVLNDRHWISDVIAGAGIGLLSAELGCMDWAKEKNNESSFIIPVYSKEVKGLAFIKRF